MSYSFMKGVTNNIFYGKYSSKQQNAYSFGSISISEQSRIQTYHDLHLLFLRSLLSTLTLSVASLTFSPMEIIV